MMSELTTLTNRLLKQGKEYIDVRIALFKLEAVEQNARMISGLITAVILSIFGSLFLIMISIAAAFWIGEMLDASYKGFLLVAAFYLLLGLLVFIFRKRWIQDSVTDTILNSFLEKGDEDEA